MKKLAIVIAAAIALTCAFAEEQNYDEPPAPPSGEEMQFGRDGEMPPTPPDWGDGEMPPEPPNWGDDEMPPSPPDWGDDEMPPSPPDWGDGEMPPEPPNQRDGEMPSLPNDTQGDCNNCGMQCQAFGGPGNKR